MGFSVQGQGKISTSFYNEMVNSQVCKGWHGDFLQRDISFRVFCQARFPSPQGKFLKFAGLVYCHDKPLRVVDEMCITTSAKVLFYLPYLNSKFVPH